MRCINVFISNVVMQKMSIFLHLRLVHSGLYSNRGEIRCTNANLNFLIINHQIKSIFRYARNSRYKLIHNLNYWAPFPIDQDFYLSPTFQDLLVRTLHNETLHWYKKSLKAYYQRPEYELFDLKVDPQERYNVASKPSYQVSLHFFTSTHFRYCVSIHLVL